MKSSDTRRIIKWRKSGQKVSTIDEKVFFIKNWKYRFNIWFIHSFHDKIQFKRLFNIFVFWNIQFKRLFNNRFFQKFQLKKYSKIWIELYSIQQNIYSIRKPRYRPPLSSSSSDKKAIKSLHLHTNGMGWKEICLSIASTSSVFMEIVESPT